jgi:hypothetical protein
VLNDRLINLEGSGSGLIEVLSRHLPGGSEGKNEKPIGIADVSVLIRTEHFSETRALSVRRGYRC